MILVKKVFTFFSPKSSVCHARLRAGLFIQETAYGGLSYKVKLQKTPINNQSLRKEATNGFEPMIRELQSHALPLG